MELTSTAFASNNTIPRRHSMEGENLSPPLKWDGAPVGTRSFALIVEDPDAPKGTFRHWAAYDIEYSRHELAEGVPNVAEEGRIRQGVNDFGENGWSGPKPPPGHGPHHYHFRLMALDTEHLDIAPDAKVADIAKAAEPHKLAEAELIGIYEIRQ